MRIFNKDTLICALAILFLSGCPSVREESELTSRCDGTASPFASGSGSVSDPYLICSVTQLKNVTNYLSSSFKLGKSISLQGASFSPIGTNDTTGYSGTFDGAGYTISNWTYSSANDPYSIGFVRKLSAGGVIKNLTLSSVILTGNDMVAGFAGFSAGTITSVTLKNSTLIGKSTVAGIVGEGSGSATLSSSYVNTVLITSTANGSRISDSSYRTGLGGAVGVWLGTGTVSDVSVSGSTLNFTKASLLHDYLNSAAGGVIGYLDSAASVFRVSFTGASSKIDGYFNVGGAVGYSNGTVSESFVNSTIEGNTRVGGICGFSSGITDKSFFVGTVIGDYVTDGIANGPIKGSVAGLIGVLSGTLSESFFSGAINADTIVGGLVGTASGADIHDCYARGTVNGNTAPVGGAIGIIFGGTCDRIYSYLTSLTSGDGLEKAMIGMVIPLASPTPTPVPEPRLFYFQVSAPNTNGGLPIASASAMNDLTNFTDFAASGKWRTSTAYSGRSGLSPVLAWECSLSGVTCAP